MKPGDSDMRKLSSLEVRPPLAAQLASGALTLTFAGLLLALVFPIDGDRQGGPPYSLSPELYEPLLSDNFE